MVTNKSEKQKDSLSCEQLQPKSLFIHHALWVGFTLIVFAALVKLSLWQYGRGVDKQQRLTRIEQLNQQSPLTLDQIVLLSTNLASEGKNTSENINDYPVTMSGDFDDEKIFLLDNQVEKGALGYRVFQIVRSDKYTVLVNLGWVQGSINRQELPTFTPISGKHHFTGHIRVVESGIMLMKQSIQDVVWPFRVQQIEVDLFAKLINQQLLPFVVYVDEKEQLGYKKNWHPIVMPPEKHQAYSVQWAGLAIAWLILMIWFNLVERGQKQKNKNNDTKHIASKIANNNKNSRDKETPDE